MTSSNNKADVIVIGAGIGGIGTALHIKKSAPGHKVIILEGRSDLGGTWDLFRYPGVRSDSDMLTFSFADHPWVSDRVLSPGEQIKQYIDDTAQQEGIKDYIQFNTQVQSANFDSKTNLWTLRAVQNGEPITFSGRILVGATGYYDYRKGNQPQFPHMETFKGQLVYPQSWPEKIEYSGKRFVIIGSGATAVTLLPNLAELGAYPTILQRTPTYLASLPLVDWIYTHVLRRILPAKLAYLLARWRLIMFQYLTYWGIRRFPRFATWYLKSQIKRQLKGSKVDADIHFSPPYKPWDQRLCVVPDNDLFKCLKAGKADIVTDKIKRFDATGIQLESGRHLDADVIVSATGLQVQVLGGVKLSVDGKAYDPSQHCLYKGVLVDGLPNFALILGYINQSWTLKVDLAGTYIAKLLEEMKARNVQRFTVEMGNAKVTSSPVMGQLDAGYIKRSAHLLPKQGDQPQFIMNNDYLMDRKFLLRPTFTDENLVFSS